MTLSIFVFKISLIPLYRIAMQEEITKVKFLWLIYKFHENFLPINIEAIYMVIP